MKIEIRKIKLKNLEEFILSKDFLALKEKPISTLRVKSYITNPNANLENYVLYMAFNENNLVGYRTILEDVFYENKTQVSFGWLSGNWVNKQYRRKRVSTKLLQEVLKDWDNKLMFSNYAQASKLLYDKTEQFIQFAELNGYRYYFKSCAAQILPNKHTVFRLLKPLLKVVDAIINTFIPYKKSNTSNFTINEIKAWNKSHLAFLESFKEKELFKRDSKTYNWVIQNPWVKSDKTIKKEGKNYNFSLYATSFNNSFYELKKENKLIGIVQLLKKDKELKIPYVYIKDNHIMEAKEFILEYIKLNKLHFVTIYNSAIHSEFQKNKAYQYKKSFSQKFFCSSQLYSYIKIANNKLVNPGDGDSVFT